MRTKEVALPLAVRFVDRSEVVVDVMVASEADLRRTDGRHHKYEIKDGTVLVSSGGATLDRES